jgi:hypothetical protein
VRNVVDVLYNADHAFNIGMSSVLVKADCIYILVSTVILNMLATRATLHSTCSES